MSAVSPFFSTLCPLKPLFHCYRFLVWINIARGAVALKTLQSCFYRLLNVLQQLTVFSYSDVCLVNHPCTSNTLTEKTCICYVRHVPSPGPEHHPPFPFKFSQSRVQSGHFLLHMMSMMQQISRLEMFRFDVRQCHLCERLWVCSLIGPNEEFQCLIRAVNIHPHLFKLQ